MPRANPDLSVSLARHWATHVRIRHHFSTGDQPRWWHLAGWLAASIASGPLAAAFADLAATWL